MIRREEALLLEEEQANPGDQSKLAKSGAARKPLIATWLSEFEERIAQDFRNRTGLDYNSTISLIIETAEPFPGMKVLDIPTRTGVIARQFAGKVGQNGKIIGVEETREDLEQARLAAQSAKVSTHIEWRPMPFDKLKFENDSFDLVTSVMSFHRIDSEKFLSEAYRILKSGGRLLIADELAPREGKESFRASLKRSYYRYIVRDKVEAEANFHTTEEMISLLKAAGFHQFMFRGLRQRSKHDRVFTLINAVK
ncbi:MAG: methyltransferase domain-containing protein [Acidobacteria bacterium]|nr:methyltransferase domain-containing protein [Acidobacteriota bacterium]